MALRFTLLMFVTTLFSYGSYGPVFTDTPEKMKVVFAVNEFDLIIKDLRDSISDRPLLINTVTFGGEFDSVSPKIPDELESSLIEIVNNSKTTGVEDVTIEVLIINAFQKFYMKGGAEFEMVEVELTVKAIDKSNGREIDNKTVRSWGKKKSLDAKYKRINRMYLNAYRQAFKKALGQLLIQPNG
jgi:hypothetical protein